MSAEVPYDPEPKKIVSRKRMLEILERHSKRIQMNLDQEIWLANRLRVQGVADVFSGDTTREMRRERVRSAIAAKKLAERVCGKRQGKECTFAEVFILVYGTSL